MKRMRKRLTAAALCGVMVAAGTSPASAALTAQQNRVVDESMARYSDLFGLTPEQRLEDYDALWNTLEDGFANWGVAERKGVDLDAVREYYRNRVISDDSDFGLFMAVLNSTNELGGVGHLGLLAGDFQQMLAVGYRSVAEGSPQDAAWLGPWIDTLGDSRGLENGGKALEVLEELKQQVYGSPQEEAAAAGRQQEPNVTFELLGGDVAYMKIRQMLLDFETDRETVEECFRRAKACGHLIIDISENSGGNYQYWQELLVAPNIDRPMTYGSYQLYRDCPNNRRFLNAFGGLESLRPIRELPNLPLLDQDDRARADYFTREISTVRPASDQKAFNGRIWVLVGPAVYSSSERFAAFCKQTGFATLVGSPTGGDGFGSEPVYCMLPNSHLLVRYSMMTGLNPDGRNNEEYGTSPDITRRKDETALDACLRAIYRGK